MPHDGVGPTKNIGITPEDAATDYRRILGSGGETSRTPPSVIEQESELPRWAARAGRLLDRKEWLSPLIEGGQEHDMFLDELSNRVVKITTLGGWGRFPAARRNGTLGMRPATPLEYFDRMALSNQLFGDDVLFHGVIVDRHIPRIVISQKLIIGRKSTVEEIDSVMKSFGFDRIAKGISMFENREKNLAVFDAHDGNFLTGLSGQVFVIDVIPSQVTREIFAGFEKMRQLNG